jgi:hypothetical protein
MLWVTTEILSYDWLRKSRQVTAFKIFWRWKSHKPGRPALPKDLRELVLRMARENATWGEKRIAHELSLKLGIRVSPRTVGKYLERDRPRGGSGQRWTTFVRNHAQAVVACDLFVSVTASFRLVYVFVAMEIGSRRILYSNVTDRPTAGWTIQQFREFTECDLRASASARLFVRKSTRVRAASGTGPGSKTKFGFVQIICERIAKPEFSIPRATSPEWTPACQIYATSPGNKL